MANTNNRFVSKHDKLRDRVKARALLKRLQENALGTLQPPMTTQQIRSAEILLRKTLPDLTAITLQDEAGNGVAASVTINL